MRSSKGFTLVEILVAISLAGIVLTALLTFFVNFIQQQVRSQNERAALETVRFLFADLSRELYFGSEYTCGSTVKDPCSCLAFTDQLGRRIKTRHIEEKRDTDGNITGNGYVEQAVRRLDPNSDTCDNQADKWIPFTSDAVSVKNLVFEIESGEQSRISMNVTAGYRIGTEDREISFKTRILGRIIEPNDTKLLTFATQSDQESQNSSSAYYYAFGDPLRDEDGNLVDVDRKTIVSDPRYVCQDSQGGIFCNGFCTNAVTPVAVEFTNDGLYALGNNGLLFFIPTSAINTALDASGAVGTRNPVYVASSSIQSDLERVIGTGSCRFCPDAPEAITEIHPAGDYLYALSENGALYVVNDARAERILSGGLATNTVIDFDVADDRVLIFFRNANRERILRLYSGSTALSGNDITNPCTEFSYMPGTGSGDRCRQLRPDPIDNGVPVKPDAELTNIQLSLFDQMQVIEQDGDQNDTVSLWYRSKIGGTQNTLSIGKSSFAKNRADGVAEGGAFAYGNGLSVHTSICVNGEEVSLCALDDLSDDSITYITVQGDPTLKDHLHFIGYPVGITTDGRLMYFSGVTASSTSTRVPVYNLHGVPNDSRRVLCGTRSQIGYDKEEYQISFSYLSEKHPGSTKNMVALIGKSLNLEGGYRDEIYIIETSTNGKNQYGITSGDNLSGELRIVCGATDYVERHRLPVGNGPGVTTIGPNLDLLRLRGVELRDVNPDPDAKYQESCQSSG